MLLISHNQEIDFYEVHTIIEASFLFVNAINKIYQFKVKDFEIKDYTLCLGNIVWVN